MILLRFSVSGYRGFCDRIELDLTDKRNYQFGKDCLRGEVLDKIIIVGGNGAGKTNFGYAMTDIVTTVTGFNRDIGQMNEGCFINGCCEDRVAEFCYVFVHRGFRIEFTYTKNTPTSIVSERLVVDGVTAFYYSLHEKGRSVFDTRLMGMEWMDYSVLDGRTSIIRTIVKEAGCDADSAVGAIWSFASHALFYRSMWKKDEHIGLMDSDDDVETYIIGNSLVDEFSSFLREAGLECGDIGVSGRRLVIRTGDRSIPFIDAASRGTMIMCRLFCWIKRCRDLDALIFFDDFDDMFHYATARNTIRTIISSNRSQCIFVTHNSGLITNDFLRPDCCFILEDGKLSSLASRTEKDIRKGHNLEKMLRDGVFDRSFE